MKIVQGNLERNYHIHAIMYDNQATTLDCNPNHGEGVQFRDCISFHYLSGLCW